MSLLIDGKDLRELVGEAGPGSFVGLPAEVALLPSTHLLGRPNDAFTIEGRPALLVCPICADLECGAVTARVERRTASVRWTDFESARFDVESGTWHLTGIAAGPFSFENRAYESALRPQPPASRESGLSGSNR